MCPFWFQCRRIGRLTALVASAAATLILLGCRQSPTTEAPPDPAAEAVKLYVFDCGRLKVEDPSRFNLSKEEVAVLDLSVGCYLVDHPNGTLMWDTGVVPDSAFPADGGPGIKEYATAQRQLLPQLAEAGFSPSDITYLALSHAHWDHVANASSFAGATWLVRQVERDALFADPPPVRTDASMFEPLRDTRTIFLDTDDYDVFGDGRVVIKFAPGHTAGHQVLYVDLADTGPVVLSGDIYHYPEELTVERYPENEVDKGATRQSREKLQAFLRETGAQLWIQHDLAAFEQLKKAPEFYQ